MTKKIVCALFSLTLLGAGCGTTGSTLGFDQDNAQRGDLENNECPSMGCQFGEGPDEDEDGDGCADSCLEEPVACTEEAMVCDDGSVVGRTGPDCEFVCPEEPEPTDCPEGFMLLDNECMDECIVMDCGILVCYAGQCLEECPQDMPDCVEPSEDECPLLGCQFGEGPDEDGDGCADSCLEEPVACTQDAMICDDGSVVGRSGPDCEFVCPEPSEPTPEGECESDSDCADGEFCELLLACSSADCPPSVGVCSAVVDEFVVCTQDAMICDDGSIVGRTGPDCEFVCPEEPGDNLECPAMGCQFGEGPDEDGDGCADSCLDEPVACTEEAMVCDDGSVVGRTGPDCEFVCPEPSEPTSEDECESDSDCEADEVCFFYFHSLVGECVTEESPLCTMDVFACTDGSYVGRTGADCEFICPEPSQPTPEGECESDSDCADGEFCELLLSCSAEGCPPSVGVCSPAVDDFVFCPEDAMVCDDGSVVGRTGPDCEFICPEPSEPTPEGECESDSDCEDGEFCELLLSCSAEGCPPSVGVCSPAVANVVACQENDDCEEGEVCDIYFGQEYGECVVAESPSTDDCPLLGC